MELDVADPHLPDLPPIPALAWRPSWQKMVSTLNRRAANRPTHNDQPFSVKASIKNECLYIKKQFS
jgi:hypothetical protein